MRTRIYLILTVLACLNVVLVFRLYGLPRDPYALAEASAEGDRNRINELLGQGADVNYPDKSGQSPLGHVVRNGSKPLTDLFLRQGANPDRIDSYGLTPLMEAVILARPDILSLLLGYGADPNYVSEGSLLQGQIPPQPLSALTLAINRREFAMARTLMKHGATALLSVPAFGSNRPAFPPSIPQPAFSYNVDAVTWQALGRLQNNTVSPDWALEQNRQWLLHHAAYTNNIQLLMLGFYKEELSLDTRSSHGVTPLMVASRYGYFGIASFLLNRGANPRIRDNEGRSALAYASASGNRELVSLLAAGFAGEKEKSPSLIASPYLYALLNADSAMFRHLFDMGFVWVDLFLAGGITLPMTAAWLGDEFALSFLLPYIDSRTDESGRNSLAWALAAFRGEREVGRILGQPSRAERFYSLLRKLASVVSLRRNTDPLIIESWSEQPFRESGIRRWRQLAPPPVPLAGEAGDYTVHKIIRNEEAIE